MGGRGWEVLNCSFLRTRGFSFCTRHHFFYIHHFEWKINFAPLSLTCLNVKCELRICSYTSFIHVFFISPQILSSCQFVVVFINICARRWCLPLFCYWHREFSCLNFFFCVFHVYVLTIRMNHQFVWSKWR